MILTMIFMYAKRNRDYYFSIHLIFYRAHQVPQYYKKWSIHHIFFAVSPPKIYTLRKKIVNCANFKM